jgi:hypothetical protein
LEEGASEEAKQKQEKAQQERIAQLATNLRFIKLEPYINGSKGCFKLGWSF